MIRRRFQIPPRPSPLPRREKGFTLIEVLIAVAITALMGGLAAAAFNSGFRAKQTVEAEAERYRMVRTALSRMCREIGGAFISDRYDLRRYRDQNDRPTNFIGEKDKLTFTTLTHQRVYADAKESDQSIVEFEVKSAQAPGPEARNRKDLFRRENPVLGERLDRGGTEDVLLDGVKRVEFAYWDPDRKEWVDEWDTRRTEKKSILPSRVRMSVFMDDEEGKEIRYSTQARIALNTELPRY